MRFHFYKGLFVIVWLLGCVSPLLVPSWAQVSLTSGSILGNVKDASGAVLPGVEITVRHQETGLLRRATANDSGNYSIPQLPVGTYRVSASLPGFKTAVTENITLEVNQKARVDFSLGVGEISERVEATGVAPLLDTDTATVGRVIDRKQVEELPLNGRNFLQLALLIPGAVEGVGSRQESRTGAAVSVNGLRPANNSYSVDGIDSNDYLNNFFTFRPNIDAIQEFKVLTNLYDAEFGRAGGAQVNVATKSGSNKYHGTIFNFHRNADLNASNFFSGGQKSPLVFNQFGGTFGFPLVKDRTFGFLEYQGLRERRGSLKQGRVPSAAQRGGDLSDLGRAVKDPLTGQPLPNNIIPASRLDLVVQRAFQFVPLPNRAVEPGRLNFESFQKNKRDANQYGIRIDHHFSDKDALFVRFSSWTLDDRLPGVFPTEAIGNGGFGSGVENDERVRNLVISYTHVFNPATLNESRAGYNRNRVFRMALFSDRNWAQVLGIEGLSDKPRDFEFPGFSITGWTSYGFASAFIPNNRIDENAQFSDTLSLVRGNHTMKTGVDIRRIRLDGFFPPDVAGAFFFDGRFSGDGLSDLLLGLPNRSSRTAVGDFVRDRAIWAAAFFQDDWNVARKLTFNLGLRWDFFQPPVEQQDRKGVFDPSQGRLIRVRTGGIPRGGFRKDANNLGPRIGFAYRPTTWLVLRGGYGIFYTSESLNVQNNLGRVPPWQVNVTAFSDPQTPTLRIEDALAVGNPQLFPTVNGIDRNWRDAYIQHFNLLTQYQIRHDLMVEAGYVGTRGVALMALPNINQPPPGPGSLQPRRPFPQEFSSIFVLSPIGNSTYHSFQLKVDKRLSRGLAFLASYTLGKAISDSDEFGQGFQDVRNRRADRGLSQFHVRQRFTTSFSYMLPFGIDPSHGASWGRATDAILGGWQIVGVLTLRDGFPFTPVVSGDPANTGSSSRPDRIADGRLKRRRLERWFDASAFAAPARFTFANAGRNILFAPGFANLDVSALKHFRLPWFTQEGARLQFRAEFFNLTNTPHLGSPFSNILVPSLAGRILSAGGEREIQLALKLIF